MKNPDILTEMFNLYLECPKCNHREPIHEVLNKWFPVEKEEKNKKKKL